MPNLPRQRSKIRVPAVLFGLSCLLIGCGDQNAEHQAVLQGARHLAAVGSGSLSESQHTYANVSREMSGPGAGDGTAAAIAAGIHAQSRQGEGSLAATRAMVAERGLFAEISAANAGLMSFLEFRTRAAALAAYDPSADLAAIAGDAERLQARADRSRAERARVGEQIDTLRSRIDALGAESRAKRNEAAELKLKSVQLSAVESARQALIVRALVREADALDMEIGRLVGQFETMRPRVVEIESEIAKFVEQRELALAFAEELRAMARDRAEQAVRARAAAAEQAERIDAIIADIAAQRRDSVIPTSDAAFDAFEQASRSSDRAVRGSPLAGRLSKASTQRRLGEALRIRAEGHARFATLLETLANARPELPRSREYAEMAAMERSAEASHHARAISAFEQAASSLRASGLRGPERDSLEQAAGEIDALIAVLRGSSPAPEVPAEPEPEWGSGEP